ncbi:putative adhesin [Streptomyces sp. NPDC091376]|uniref:putative adhesin n=1 Tax=Streptomyces sp. NPDC091376 TaxID=3365994 RepID=UPI00380E98DF
MESWIIGHGEMPGTEEVFVPDGTTLVYYVKSGFANNMPNALAELSACGEVDAWGDFEERCEYPPGSLVPNHRLGEFSTTEMNNVYQVLWDSGQDIHFIGQFGLYNGIRLCAAPHTCRPPLHGCVGLLADPRVAGKRVHLVCCRGRASDLLRNTPPVMRDEYGSGANQFTNYAYDKVDELHGMTRQPGGWEHALDELQSLTVPMQAMTLTSSKEFAEKARNLDTAMTEIRSGRPWFDPRDVASIPGVWRSISRMYQPDWPARAAAAFKEFPRITLEDCPVNISECVEGVWYPVFTSWYWHDRGSPISRPLLRFNEAKEVRSLARLVVDVNSEDNAEYPTSDAFWVISDFFSLVRKANADLIIQGVPEMLTAGESSLAKFREWDEAMRTHSGHPEPVTPGDPRIRLLREALKTAAIIAKAVQGWRELTHRRFCVSLSRLTPADILEVN